MIKEDFEEERDHYCWIMGEMRIEERGEKRRGKMGRRLWAIPRSEFFSSFPVSVFLFLFSSPLLTEFINIQPLRDNLIVWRPFLRLNRQILPFRYIQKRKRETKKRESGALTVVAPAIRRFSPLFWIKYTKFDKKIVNFSLF